MKLLRLLTVLLIAMSIVLVACGPQATPTKVKPQAPAVEPPPVVPTEPAPVEVIVPSPTTGVQYAPFCPAGNVPAQCQAPVGETIGKFCTKKIPYTLVTVPPETTFEVLTPGLKCENSGVRSGSLMLTCTGKELFSFDLKLCNPACGSTTSGLDTGQCPQGFSYDASQQCCASAPPAGDLGCVQYKVDIGACP